MVKLDLHFEADRAHTMLHGIEDRLEDRNVLEILGEELIAHEQDVFASGGFGQWAPLSPATIAGKNTGRVLVDTGRLENLLTSRSSLDIGSDDVGLAEDQVAGLMRIGARGAPARNPNPAPEASKLRDWAKTALRYVTEGTR